MRVHARHEKSIVLLIKARQEPIWVDLEVAGTLVKLNDYKFLRCMELSSSTERCPCHGISTENR